MYQEISLIGNLGGEPEMRYTQGGIPVTSFSLAVTKRWKGSDGQQQERTTWFRVSAWRGLAEPCSNYLHQGSRVFVVGEVEGAHPYKDRDGNPQASIEVSAQTVRFLDAKGETTTPPPTNQQPVDEDESIPV